MPLPEVLAASEEADADDAPSQGQRGVLWFANVYPTKAFRMDFRQELTHHNHETLIPKLLPEGVEVIRMVPREREGGAFVYFRAPPSFVFQVLTNLSKEADGGKEVRKRFVSKGQGDVLGKVCAGISQYLRNHEVRAFLCPYPVRAHRVVGDPFLEDLQSRFPSSRLRIRLEPQCKLTEETLYEKLRKYGTLLDIERLPDNKGFSASFQYTAAAVAARNCLHRAPLSPEEFAHGGLPEGSPAPVFHMEFEPFMRKWMRQALTENARYTIPLLVACMLGTTYFIWDPLRTFSVQLRIAGLLSATPVEADVDAASDETDGKRRPQVGGLWGFLLSGWGYWNRAQHSLTATLRGHGLRGETGRSLLADFWADRDQEVHELKQWLTDMQDRVMLLTGHRGNGQSSLVREVLDMQAIYIDVAHMLEAGGSVDDQIFLKHLCRSVGYWPAQGMDRQMTAILDLMLPGSGKLSRENEVLVAVQRVLSCVTGALRGWRRLRPMEDLSSASVPLIVVDGFTAENQGRREGFFDSLVTWAAYVSESGLARVLFIADSSFAEPAMLAALGNRPERLDVLELRDAEPAAVRSILERHFGSKQRICQLSDAELACVGGRFRDIAAFCAHVHEGCPPGTAVRRLVEGAEDTVRNLLMRGQQGAKWTRPQLWRAVRLLAEASPEDGVPYDVFLWQVFRGDEAALQSMKESNLISVASREPHTLTADRDNVRNRTARRYKVLPGSPLFAEVYWRLADHAGLAAVLDLEVAKEDIKREHKNLQEYEADLVRLQEVDDVRREKFRALPDPNEALRKRKEQLLGLVLEQHDKLEAYHKARRAATGVLNERKKQFRSEIDRREARPAGDHRPAERWAWFAWRPTWWAAGRAA